MKTFTLSAVTVAVLAGAALAHGGVKDPTVKARMDMMGAIKNNMAVLGDMAKGKRPFDPAAAAQAQQALGEWSRQIAPSFEVPASDPKSEALPAIWENWPDFVQKAADMESVVGSADVSTLEGVRSSIPMIGKTCGSCHQSYRLDN